MDALQLSSVEWVVILTSLTSGAIGALGLGSYLYFRERTRLKERRARRERHLEHLQRLTSKLLNALDRLLGGTSPEEAILYHRFRALGGEFYADAQAEFHDTLQRSQGALAAAFDLHHKLVDPDRQQGRSLEQRTWDWELLYATLIGHNEQIQNMTGDEIRTLLDPLVDPDREPEANNLAEQLEELRRELAGQPLKVKWQQIYPGQLEAEGLLDGIAQLKTQLARLPERHKQEAPYWLVEARAQRQQAQAEIPAFLPELYRYIVADGESAVPSLDTAAELTTEQLFRDVEMRLAETEAAQTMGRFLEVIERSHDIWRDMETLRAFLRAMNEHGRQRVKLEAITAQGYQPPHLAADLHEIKADVQTITRRLGNGNYTAAMPWIEELSTDSQRVLAEAEAWQALHHQNIADLDHLGDQVAHLAQWWQHEVAPAWEQLQTCSQANWSDIAADIEQAQQSFQRLQEEQLDQLESLNSLEVQKLNEAERLLTYAKGDLAQAAQQFQVVINRWAEVQAAKTHLAEALRLTKADLARAEGLRDQEDAKIGPEVDHQIDQARRHVAEAQRLTEAGEFLAAVDEQTAARQLATAAYVTADEQVREINALLAQLETITQQSETKIAQCLAEARRLAAVVQTVSTGRLTRQLQEQLSEAEQARLATTDLEDQALAEGLRSATVAYERVDQQADWVSQQVAADQAEYNQMLDETRLILAEAEAALQQARQVVGQVPTHETGQHALRRAEATLPSREETEQATRAALDRLREQAETTIRDARWAESQAHRQTRLHQIKHRLHQPAPDQDPKPRLRRLGDQTERNATKV